MELRTAMAIVDVKAEVAGIVWKIAAAPGQEVGEEEPIVILEAMKMEIPVLAPKPCKVVAILVSEQDVVDEGMAVARIEI